MWYFSLFIKIVMWVAGVRYQVSGLQFQEKVFTLIS